MIITDLDHLQVVAPKTNLVGGYINNSAYAEADVYAYAQKAFVSATTKTFAITGSLSGSF
ncbi:MAG: hypothetical protein WCD53_17225 [Microcoleus sp.]